MIDELLSSIDSPAGTSRQEGWLVDSILNDNAVAARDRFFPKAPETIEATCLQTTQIESLLLKYLMHRGSATCRQVADQIRLPFALVSELARRLKDEQVVAYRRSAGLNDYELQLAEAGAAQAKRYNEAGSYFGAAPVPYKEYVDAIAKQSPSLLKLNMASLRPALADLSIADEVCSRLGQAMTAGRALFLYGQPGNGKTSIAERLSAAYGHSIWIPRAVEFDGEIVRIFDPIVHEEVQSDLGQSGKTDPRWVCIKRPTIVVGGELRMEHLEVIPNTILGVNEAPLQLKSNGGVLVIDDFGRQQMDPTELLNRWIVPLEKRYDFLNLPSGKKIQIPFDQLLIFSTNLEPKDIVDEAFLRRIPYKIEILDPQESDFRALFRQQAERLGIAFDEKVLDYLLDSHYRPANRPFRFCHPRDILLQVKNFCTFHDAEAKLTRETLEMAVQNYFAMME